MTALKVPSAGTLFGNFRFVAGTTPDHYRRQRASVKCTRCLETKTVLLSDLLKGRVVFCKGCRRKAKYAGQGSSG